MSPAIEALNDPESKRFWGVETAAAVDVPFILDGKREVKVIERPILKFELGERFMRCIDILNCFLDEEVLCWYSEYQWIEKSGSRFEYLETNPNYHLSVGIFETFFNKFSRVKK